jgi:hypothetical protein
VRVDRPFEHGLSLSQPVVQRAGVFMEPRDVTLQILGVGHVPSTVFRMLTQKCMTVLHLVLIGAQCLVLRVQFFIRHRAHSIAELKPGSGPLFSPPLVKRQDHGLRHAQALARTFQQTIALIAAVLLPRQIFRVGDQLACFIRRSSGAAAQFVSLAEKSVDSRLPFRIVVAINRHAEPASGGAGHCDG